MIPDELRTTRQTLFQLGDFTLNSGQRSRWKIECDALTPEDWEGLAAMAVEILPAFRSVHGVPRGGLPFESALAKYATGGEKHPILIAEDVVTTGGSMERFRETFAGKYVIGVCVFCRGRSWPEWVQPLFAIPWE